MGWGRIVGEGGGLSGVRGFMNGTNDFPTQFTSWHQTHFEIGSEITRQLLANIPGLVVETYEEHGTLSMYDLAKQLTDTFEKLHQGRQWDGDYFETIEAFCKEHLPTEPTDQPEINSSTTSTLTPPSADSYLNAAASAFCSGTTPLEEYHKLCKAAESGNEEDEAQEHAAVWAPLQHFTVSELIELIECHATAIESILNPS